MVALLLYVFHTDLWPEILSLISSVKDSVGIDIALYKNHNNDTIINDLKNFNLINIRYVDNHGVDISPFLHQIKDLDSNKYPYFIKLHSKKSIISKLKWRFVLFNALIGSKKILNDNQELLDNNRSIGAITDRTMIMSSIGYNKKHIQILSDILKLKKNNKKKTFMAGSMFMSRTHIFQKYLNEHTDTIDSLLENGIVKDEYCGTFCHAMERIFGKIIHNEDLSIMHSKLSPYMKIYNPGLKKTFVIYKCYNNYCYNFDTKNRVFGQTYPTISSTNQIMIDWEHLPNEDHCPKIYTQISNNQYVCMNY